MARILGGLALVALLALCGGGARAQSSGKQWLPFLLENRLPMSPMPRSYAVEPWNYFEKVPTNQKLSEYTKPVAIIQCQNKSVPPGAMNNYTFQTEKWLTTLGTDIYDAAVWCMAVTLLGEGKNCSYYLNNVLVADRTIQFGNIRGNAPCGGVEYLGQCNANIGQNCGFCYGDDYASLDTNHSYFFRMISNYWAIEGTIDERCPELKQEWIWNDYKPILGENAWANLLGPANVAMMNAKFDATKIPASDPIYSIGINFLTALHAMKVGTTGAFYYTPWNTWFNFSHGSEIVGATFSVENQASLLAGLQGLQHILKSNPTSAASVAHLDQVNGYIKGLRGLILSAFNKEKGFFRQGGTYNRSKGEIYWNQTGQPDFAVDCQTWVGAVLGTKLIDSQFGELTAYNIWQTVKNLAGWQADNGMFSGVGYTYNSIGGQVFSGEWTYGAMNWLNVMIADSGYNATLIGNLQSDLQMMQFGLETYLWDATTLNNGTKTYNSVRYSNERYWIPFGWFANPLPALCSTAWAALVESNYNPFNVVKGGYIPYDPQV